MSDAKNDLIDRVSTQFVSQLTPGYLRFFGLRSSYFNTGRPAQVTEQALNDPSVMNRIFDDITLDSKTKEEFFQAIIQSKDPIHEYLVPLINTIENRMFDPDHKDFNEKIRSDYAKYTELRKKFEDDTFHDTMLRAIGSACLSFASDILSKKLKDSTSDDSRQSLARQFSTKIATPFDEYIKILTGQKLQQDVNNSQDKTVSMGEKSNVPRLKLFTLILRALLSLVRIFTRRHRSAQDLGLDSVDRDMHMDVVSGLLEEKIGKLITIVDRALDKLAHQNDSINDAQQKFIQGISIFRDNLEGLIEEIRDSRDMGFDCGAKIQTGLVGLCTSFSDRAETYFQEQGEKMPNSQDREVVDDLIKDLTKDLTPTLADPTPHSATDPEESSEHNASPPSNRSRSPR